MYMCLGYATKSTLGHKAGKTTHRELELIGFVSVFDSASKSLKRHQLFHYKKGGNRRMYMYICTYTYVHVHMGGIDECTRTFARLDRNCETSRVFDTLPVIKCQKHKTFHTFG